MGLVLEFGSRESTSLEHLDNATQSIKTFMQHMTNGHIGNTFGEE